MFKLAYCWSLFERRGSSKAGREGGRRELGLVNVMRRTMNAIVLVLICLVKLSGVIHALVRHWTLFVHFSMPVSREARVQPKPMVSLFAASLGPFPPSRLSCSLRSRQVLAGIWHQSLATWLACDWFRPPHCPTRPTGAPLYRTLPPDSPVLPVMPRLWRTGVWPGSVVVYYCFLLRPLLLMLLWMTATALVCRCRWPRRPSCHLRRLRLSMSTAPCRRARCRAGCHPWRAPWDFWSCSPRLTAAGRGRGFVWPSASWRSVSWGCGGGGLGSCVE